MVGGTDHGEIDAILAAAPRRVRLTLQNQRVAGVPLEPRGATALFDDATGRYTLHSARKAPARCGRRSPRQWGSIPASSASHRRRRGSFGRRLQAIPNIRRSFAQPAGSADRPLNASRSEAFVSDNQAATILPRRVAMDAAGSSWRLRWTRSPIWGRPQRQPAHISHRQFRPLLPASTISPHCRARALRLHQHRADRTYRGAGRNEANYVLERLVDAAARETGLDRVRLRRLNLLPPEAMPHPTAVGTVSQRRVRGDPRQALQAADYGNFVRRRAEAAGRGKLRGIGIACFLEHAGAMGLETVEIRFAAGGVALEIGVQSTGQAHGTIFPKLLAGRLGIDRGCIALRQGDSDVALKGGPSVASRSTMTVGAALLKAVEGVVAKGRRLAAEALEADEADVIYQAGVFRVTGTDRVIRSWPCGARRQRPSIRETTDVPQSFRTAARGGVEIDRKRARSRSRVCSPSTIADRARPRAGGGPGARRNRSRARAGAPEAVIHDSESGR